MSETLPVCIRTVYLTHLFNNKCVMVSMLPLIALVMDIIIPVLVLSSIFLDLNFIGLLKLILIILLAATSTAPFTGLADVTVRTLLTVTFTV